MSSKRLDTIADYRREGLDLRVECRCGRVVLLDSHDLLLRCHRAGKSKVIEHVVARLRCGDCGARPSDWGPT